MKHYSLGIVIIICTIVIVINNCTNDPPVASIEPITDTISTPVVIDTIIEPKFLKEDTVSLKALKAALIYYKIEHPEIVFAQAILETGWLKSEVCQDYNNLFGLYHYRKKDFYKFDHWSVSVPKYAKYIQYKYHSSKYDSYYDFLDDVGYAEDPEYIAKLQSLEDQWENI